MPNYLKYVFNLSLKQKKTVAYLITLTIVSVLARLAEPYLYKVVVDTLTNGLMQKVFLASQIHMLIVAVVIWFFLAIMLNLTSSQTSFLTWTIGGQNAKEVNLAGYRRILQLDYSKHMSAHSSRYAKIVDDADYGMWEMSNWWLGRFLSAVLGFIGMLILALSISWQMTLIAVSIIPPTLWFIIRHVKKYEDEQRKINKLWEERHEHTSDQISNIVTYKLNPHEDIFVDRHKVYVEKARSAQDELNKKWRLVDMLNPDAFARFLVLGFGIFLVQNNSITLGTLFMFMGLLNEILNPLHLLSDILPQYTRRAQQIERLLGLLAQKDKVSNPGQPIHIDEIKGKVECDHVSFNYAKNKNKRGFELVDVSFSIEPGQTVALVGHSGSGKSTIMTLLTRLVDPISGTITIDGIDIRKFNLEEIKKYVAAVLQENAMYNETVAENIAYGNPLATRQDIIEAAEQADADEFIQKLPKGYDTLIGERGVRLSGGEKQRVAIARAILKNPKIVVLDEPTSALDSVTEEKVQRGIRQLMKSRTTLIIAHRLSTVLSADVIMVIEKGKIICSGPHAEIIKTCPIYKTMVDLQTKGFLAE